MSDQPEPTLYDELGVDPGASPQELRAGYRRQARRRHPDVAAGTDESSSGDAMRRLNEAWAVLGDPETRQRYDESRARAAVDDGPVPPARQWDAADGAGRDNEPVVGPRLPLVRPSALILVVLAIIFVVTAYAGSWPGSNAGSTTTTVGGAGAGAGGGVGGGSAGGGSAGGGSSGGGGAAVGSVVGQCVAGVPVGRTGAPPRVVACSSANDGQILVVVAGAAQCPAGTLGYATAPPAMILCAVTTRGGPTAP